MEERRSSSNPFDVSGLVAIIYTLGFLALATLLYFVPIPATNKDALLYLFGVLSGIQLSIMAFLYGGSKALEASQRATEQRQGRSAAVVEEIAKAAAPVAAAAVAAATGAPTQPAVTPAAENPVTGNIPAAEVQSPEKGKP